MTAKTDAYTVLPPPLTAEQKAPPELQAAEPIEPSRPEAKRWPAPMGDAALVGLVGEIVHAVEPTTEGDPNAILIQLLAAVGNLLGNRLHLRVDEKRHGLKIWVLVVGSTASGKKGTGANRVFSLLDDVDPTWKIRRRSGIASGEAIVHHVRDDVASKKRSVDPSGLAMETTDVTPGESDKRLFLVEEEFSRVLRLARKDCTTLSATIREAWDADVLMTTAKTSAEIATGAHVTMLGHITPEELRSEMSLVELSNGLANRFLYAASRRSKDLARPPALSVALRASFVERLQAVQSWAQALSDDETRVQLSEGAWRLWSTLKREVEAEVDLAEATGLSVTKVLTRAAPYLLRLGALYTVLDRRLLLEPRDLLAAREVWRYSVDSSKFVFGDSFDHPDVRKILGALEDSPTGALSRAEIHELFHRNRSAADLTRLRDRLLLAGKIEAVKERSVDGRGTEWWRVKPQGEG